MSKPERPVNTFYAFCSLFLPGLGQLLQKRFGAAAGFFTLFVVSGFLPVLIVSLLFMDRFSYQPLRVHLLHIFTFGGLFLLFMAAIFWAAMDAAKKPEEIPAETPEEMRYDKSKRHSHFTIIELLVVIVVIGVLVALLLPAVPSSREAARHMQCANNTKQIMLGFHNYHANYGSFPPVYTVDENGTPLHSWRVLLLPYLEYGALYEEIRLDEPWDSEHNRQFHSNAPPIFRCPSAGSPPQTVPVPAQSGSFYSVVDGEEAAFCGPQTRSKDAFALSDTIFLVERRTPVNWMDPSREITYETACQGINTDVMGISSYHAKGVNAAMADGSTQFLSDTIKPETLREMLTLDKKKK